MLVADALGEFVAGFDAARVTPQLWRKLEDLLIDAIGAAAAAQHLPAVGAVRATASALFRDGPSLVWFDGRHLSPVASAYANSAAASALDVDDGHRAAIGHPGAPIISSVLAEAAERETSPQRLAAAILLGYEVGVRAAAAQADRLQTRLYATGRWASLGVATAVGYLRGYDASRIAQALAIAAAHRPSLIPQGHGLKVGHVKEGIPWATVTGFAAAELAGNGFLGSPDLLDLAHLFDRGVFLDNLGEGFLLESTYIKPYSCCRWNHAALDALLSLMREQGLAPGDIEAVEVATFGAAVRMDNKPSPATVEAAQFSIPFSLAAVANDGPGSMLPIEPSLLGRPDVVAFAEKVSLRLDPVFEARFPGETPAHVTLRTTKGTFGRLVEHPRGEPANPLSRAEIEAKFRKLSGIVCNAQRQDWILTAIGDLRRAGADSLLAALSGASPLD